MSHAIINASNAVIATLDATVPDWRESDALAPDLHRALFILAGVLGTARYCLDCRTSITISRGVNPQPERCPSCAGKVTAAKRTISTRTGKPIKPKPKPHGELKPPRVPRPPGIPRPKPVPRAVPEKKAKALRLAAALPAVRVDRTERDDIKSCPMCLRRGRWDGQYCKAACEERAQRCR